MIPLQLTLQNFLSYRLATVDFRGLHTACICGSNGAGKSSLLEAITWVIWGKSRTPTEDDVIHGGEKHVRVNFDFISNNQTYRIIRSRQRGRSSVLEFQIQSEPDKFLSLTEKKLRATQDTIISELKLDYDTFINSAYLRQGRADEFMLRRPGERKQILADLLKLDRYEQLSGQAKDIAKQLKGQVEQLELSLQPLEEQLQRRGDIIAENASQQEQIKQLQQAQEEERAKLEQLQSIQHKRKNWEQHLNWQQTQYQNMTKDCQLLEGDRTSLKAQLSSLQQLLQQEPEITAAYNQLLQLQQEEETLSAKFQAYQEAQQQKQQLEQEINKQSNELNLEIRQTQTRLEALVAQEREIEAILKDSPQVEAGLEKLHRSRQRLQELDKIQQDISPLLQQRNSLQIEIERVEARLAAKLEQMQRTRAQLSARMERLPVMRKTALAVDGELRELEKKRVYQQRVEEKGLERRDFQKELQAKQRMCEQQLEELRQKLQMLQTPDASCPLCEQELDENHRANVVQKTQNQHQEIQQQFWMIREQLAVSERELQVLRQEYVELSQQLAPYNELQQQLGQLEAQLETTGEVYSQLQQIKTETEQLERSLAIGNYAQELQLELKALEQQLAPLQYDEQTHALVRGEVERWRWAEIKQSKIEDAKRRLAGLAKQKPQLTDRIHSLQHAIAKLRTDSEIQQQSDRLQQYLTQLAYSPTQHQNLLAELRQAQSCQLRYQELQQAKQQYPLLETRLQKLEAELNIRLEDKAAFAKQLDNFRAQMAEIRDYGEEIRVLEKQILARRKTLDELLAKKGRSQQSLTQLDKLETQYEDSCKKLKDIRRQYLVYQELSQAFGKNGIQALMIENILPQLEAQSNQILARLTGNQLHVQFLTQRVGKSSRSKKNKDTKLIDTLDILIADASGTRPYETYSGGEAFRINFAIRLALSRLLAQRAGTSLQMLIVDEGFGTQDAEGCNKLIGAINTIAADFACILTVTHMPQFKEAFQTRIEVRKTNQGSQLIMLN